MTCPSLIGYYRSRFSRLNKTQPRSPFAGVSLQIVVPPLSPLARAAASSNRLLKMSGGDGDMVIIAEKDDNPGTEDLVSEDPKEISEAICEAVEYIRTYLKKSKDEVNDMVDLEQLEELHHLVADYLKSMDEIKDRAGEEADKLNGDLTQRREVIKTATSSLEVSPDENQWRIIGKKIAYLPSKEIGLSSSGTVVYDGCYEDKPAAVKRMRLSHVKLADQEIANFLASSHHQNVVRFYGVEHNDDFVYLALERCDCNLDDLISFADSVDQYELVSNNSFHCSTTSQSLSYDVDRLEPLKKKLGDVNLWKENHGRLSPLLKNLMKDMVLGLIHLHASGLIHGDLKPQNVLIIKQGSTLCAKLSRMGISRKVRHDRNSLTNHFSRWKSREWLCHRHQTQAMDLFSLGCLLFCCITRGRHPFGEHYERETNIINDNVKNLFLIKDFPEASHLISLSLKADHLLRPKAIEVLHHPLFWDSEKRLSFLCDASEWVSENSSLLIKALESAAYITFGMKRRFLLNVVQTWSEKVDDKIIEHIGPYVEGGYNFSSIRDLLRLIRNLLNHYEQLQKDIQILVGPLHEGVDDYFTSRFPMLLIEVYKVICTHCKEEVYFKKYFKGNC